MNVTGKSLQDIYDAGSRRLDELEQGGRTALADASDAHLDERSRIEPDSLKLLEDKTGELEEEVRAFLGRGLDRVGKTVAAECQQTEQYINTLVEGLVLISKKFSESIAQLRQLAESQLTDLGEDCQHVYSLHSQATSSQVLHEGTVAVADARSEAAKSQEMIGECIEQSWSGIYEKEGEAFASIDECFDSNSAQVSEGFTTNRNDLISVAEKRLTQLQNQARTSRESTKALIERTIELSDRFAFDTDVKLKEGFSSLLYELASSFDDAAIRCGGDIASLHESSMADLTMKSQELSREMDRLGETISKSSNEKSQHHQDAGTQLLQSYTDALDAKLETSNVFHRDLESERAHMVSEIWNELTELRQNFETKIKTLSTNTLNKMRQICEEAETAVLTAQHNCLTESKNNAVAKTQTIDSTAKEYLRRIESLRKGALDGIAKAAGEDPAEARAGGKKESSAKSNDNNNSGGSLDAGDDAAANRANRNGDSSSARGETDSDEDGSEEHDEHGSARPSGEHDAGSGEPRKRRKGKSDKRSSGDKK